MWLIYFQLGSNFQMRNNPEQSVNFSAFYQANNRNKLSARHLRYNRHTLKAGKNRKRPPASDFLILPS